MTDSSTDTAVPSTFTHDGRSTVDPCLVDSVATDGGTLERLDVDGCSILLYPADALTDGLSGLWLRRRRSEGYDYVSLIGQQGITRPGDTGSPTNRTGHWGDLAVELSLTRSSRQAAWFWHVRVTNHGASPAELDLVSSQDAALAPRGAVRTNEYYVSQYLDLTPVAVPGHGVALGVRQNMPGPTPWLLVGCLGEAAGWATDALQLTGRGRPEGTPWPGLAQDLPSTRVQGEHTVAVLQTAPIRLAPRASADTGFYGLFVADHPSATTDADAAYAVAALSDPAARTPTPDPATPRPTPAPEARDHRSLFGTAGPLPCRPHTDPELDALGGGPRHQMEATADGTPLSFFTGTGAAEAHVVTAAKQAAVLRPHGHLLRSGTSLLPAEDDLTATVWMDGTFCSQLSQGHVGLGTITSLRRSYLGLAPAHGLRMFVRPTSARDDDGATGWMLLGTPSAWRVALDRCRWTYAWEGGLIQVETVLAADADAVTVEISVDGRPVDLLAAIDLPWSDADRPGVVEPQPDGVRVAAPVGSRIAARHPGAAIEIGWTPGSAPAVDDDRALFLDHATRGLPWVTVRTEARERWRLSLRPRLITPGRAEPEPPDLARTDHWGATAGAIGLDAPDTTAGQELTRIATAVPWFTHDALIHYLSPRGLEQYSGGAWGTRDVSQGPVGLLIALGAHDELRQLILMIMRAQHQRGDWPQAFEFLDRHRVGATQGHTSTAHGDVVYWPLLALGQYLAATDDHSVLTEPVTSVGDHGDTVATRVLDHVTAALDHIDSTMITGTGLPAYGHGDWNDSLQPADPELAARLCSSWTVVLQGHALGTLGRELARHDLGRDTGRRATRTAEVGLADLRRLLVVDGVLAGYGLFADDGTVEPLLHPTDRRTGLSHSLLPMIHALADDVLTPEEADLHLRLITDHLLGPDGAHLFDRPVGYAGGPMTLFQRAEASTFFGREIGIMYMHAHLRYAEALARHGDGPGLLHALALAQPVGITDRVPAARPRQSTCYFSSSDAAFPDRYAAAADYPAALDGTVPLEGGWRVYSSGPALFLQLLVESLLGVRRRADRVELDPVLDPELDGLTARLVLHGIRCTVRYRVGRLGHGVSDVRVAGVALDTTPLTNPYRVPGVSVSTAALVDLLSRPGRDAADPVLDIVTR